MEFQRKVINDLILKYLSLIAITKRKIKRTHHIKTAQSKKRSNFPVRRGQKFIKDTKLEKDKAKLVRTTTAFRALSVDPKLPFDFESHLKNDES